MTDQTHGFYQESYRGFTITSEHEGTDGEITGYTVAVDSDEASEASGEEIGSMSPNHPTLADARAFIDGEYPTPTHTPEPWYADDARPLHRRAIWASTGALVATIEAGSHQNADGTDTAMTNEEYDANAERIVACVNGCAGIANPAAVGDMRDAVYSLLAEIDARCEIIREAGCYDGTLIAAIGEARAALAKAEGRE